LFESLGPIPWFAIKGKGPKSSGSTTGTTWPARLSSALTRRAPYGPGSHVSGPFGLSSKSSFSFCGANPMFQSAESRRCTPKQKWSQLLTVCNVDGGKFKCHELSDIMWIFCKNLIIGRRTPCMLWRRVICCLQLLWSISLITMRYKSSKPLSLYKKNVFVQVLQWNRKRLVSSYLGPGQPKSPILNHFFNFNSNFSIHPSKLPHNSSMVYTGTTAITGRLLLLTWDGTLSQIGTTTTAGQAPTQHPSDK